MSAVVKLLSLLPVPGLSEREIVQRILYFAGEPTDAQKAEAWFSTQLSHGLPSKAVAQYAKQVGSDFMRKQWAAIWDERALFRSQVEAVFQNRDAARKALEAPIAAAFGDVVLVPSVTFANWSIKYELRYYAVNMRAICAFALALLLDESKGFGAVLSRCRLPNCPNFFLSLPGDKGGRPPLYCSTEHQNERANEGSAERKRRQRTKARKPK